MSMHSHPCACHSQHAKALADMDAAHARGVINGSINSALRDLTACEKAVTRARQKVEEWTDEKEVALKAQV